MFRYARAWFESIVGKPLCTRNRLRFPRSGGLHGARRERRSFLMAWR
jgi:hypothetical protein